MKPEIWEDEAIGRLGPWERLLFIGLITMADDEGRLRVLPSAIVGHVFPYDDVSPRKLLAWVDALEKFELVRLYGHDGTNYCQIKGWSKHQKVNRPQVSTIPAFSLNGHGSLHESGELKS